MSFTIVDPESGIHRLLSPVDAVNAVSFGDRWRGGVLNLVDNASDQATADHYALQWGKTVGFQSFAQGNPSAMQATPGKQLGWPRFFKEVRESARFKTVRVYDAGCGFGGLLDELFASPIPEGLVYVGADIHGSLTDIKRPVGAGPGQVTLLRWDIGEKLPVVELFDVVICRASIHHTKEPHRTFDRLAEVLAVGGRIAISAYARKGNLREAVDDGLRNVIKQLAPSDAMLVGRELAIFGRALQRASARVTIDEDLKWLGIEAGDYPLHGLIYEHLLKCWWNDAFDTQYSAVVNYDWYHPTYAFRYAFDEIARWFECNGIQINHSNSTTFQHFADGVRSA